jgi:hypothetical protein
MQNNVSTTREMKVTIGFIDDKETRIEDGHGTLRKYTYYSGPGSSVGIVTDYGLDGPGIESGGGEIFRTRPDRSLGPPSLLYNGYRVFPGGKAAGAWC